jgi:hypothetical protein
MDIGPDLLPVICNLGERVMHRFVRRENVKHYRKMLSQAKTQAERERIKKLLAEEEQKQLKAGDFTNDSDKQAS